MAVKEWTVMVWPYRRNGYEKVNGRWFNKVLDDLDKRSKDWQEIGKENYAGRR
jgi:hypothetical protein